MVILTGITADDFRKVFCSYFIDTSSIYYKKYISKLIKFSDGWCYTGYLWDCLKTKKQVPFESLIEKLCSSQNCVYALWDIHSCERILIPNYWKYPKDAVLKMEAAEILDVLPLLPEDTYFFDESLRWAFAITHEESKHGRRICYASYFADQGTLI